jgi:hypothetical protein
MNFNLDPNKPFTSEEIERLGLDTRNGLLVAIDVQAYLNNMYDPAATVGFALGRQPMPKALNLICAAPLMYQCLGQIYGMLDRVRLSIESLDKMNRDVRKAFAEEGVELALPDLSNLMTNVEGLQTHCLDMRRVAELGAEKVSQEIANESKIGVDREAPKG